MIRINLLPPEITEKRRAEKRWKYVVFGAVALYAVLAVFWFVMYLSVTQKAAEVAAKKQEAESVTRQAESFKIFEDRQKDLVARQGVVDKALTGRMQWSRLLNETALVLPSDAWLTNMQVDEKAFTISGQAVDAIGESGSSGFKPIAKLLVHMSDMQQLQNVWLNSSSKTDFKSQPTLTFSLSAEMIKAATATPTAGAAPAPPAQ